MEGYNKYHQPSDDSSSFPAHNSGDLVLEWETSAVPVRGDSDRSNTTEKPLQEAGEGERRFPINSQTLAGIAFLTAFRLYKDKNSAMALALSLECSIFWEYFAPPSSRKQSLKKRPASELLYGQEASDQTAHIPRVPLAKSRLGLPTRGRGYDEVSDPTAPVVEQSWSRLKAKSLTPPAGQRKRQRTQSPVVFSPSYLHAGMAVLLRTEADEEKGWGKCWSLGRVLRIISARRTIDVVWLRPAVNEHLSPERIFGQRWEPWTIQEDPDSPVIEWKSKGLSMSSVQYGVWFSKDGRFDADAQATLAGEVARLEVLAEEEEEEAAEANFTALRKNTPAFRGHRNS